MLSVNFGMWVLSAIVIIYVASGGLRAVAYVDTMQCVLLAGGIVAIGAIALAQVGGMGRLIDGIGALSQEDRRIGAEAVAALEERGLTFAEAQARVGAAKGAPAESPEAVEAGDLAPLVAAAKRVTPDGYSHYIAIPGVIQFVDAGGKAQGGAWTGIMVLAYMFALMGIQSAPAFTMWAFSNHNPRPFAPQTGVGVVLRHRPDPVRLYRRAGHGVAPARRRPVLRSRISRQNRGIGRAAPAQRRSVGLSRERHRRP